MNLQFKDSSLFSSFKIYEDLSRNFHDRYQYIFSEFSFSKNLDILEIIMEHLILIHMVITNTMKQILLKQF